MESRLRRRRRAKWKISRSWITTDLCSSWFIQWAEDESCWITGFENLKEWPWSTYPQSPFTSSLNRGRCLQTSEPFPEVRNWTFFHKDKGCSWYYPYVDEKYVFQDENRTKCPPLTIHPVSRFVSQTWKQFVLSESMVKLLLNGLESIRRLTSVNNPMVLCWSQHPSHSSSD